MTKREILCLLLLSLSLTLPLRAHAETYAEWLSGFKGKAERHGITAQTLQESFSGVAPNTRVIELDRKQPERKRIGFDAYLHKVMSQKRIDEGRANFAFNKSLLSSTEKTYGVPAETVVALWGIETSYGANTGGFDMVQALSTLAWEGRRRGFFENELLTALEILQGGHISRDDFKGSWAGAMGQNQFMPSSWKRYAIDADGDGHKDIWGTKADIFASSANYLKRNGWNDSYPWGWQVEMPTAAIARLAASHTKKPMVEWIKMGVHFSDGHIPNDQTATMARLVIPDGGDGRAYLVTSNFDTILTWNRSDYFALTVGLLSDFIAKSPTSNHLTLNP